MQQIVSITSQGQLTIPQSFRKALGIKKAIKASITRDGNRMIVEPKQDFWSLGGSLQSPITLTDAQLRKARDAFSQQWPSHD